MTRITLYEIMNCILGAKQTFPYVALQAPFEYKHVLTINKHKLITCEK